MTPLTLQLNSLILNVIFIVQSKFQNKYSKFIWQFDHNFLTSKKCATVSNSSWHLIFFQPLITKAYNLKRGDIVHLSLDCLDLYENHIINSIKWPIPPKHLLINYKTLQILFINNIESTNIANEFLFNLRLQKILVNYYKQ